MGNCQTKTATSVAVPKGVSNDTANLDNRSIDSEVNHHLLIPEDSRESGGGSVAGKSDLEPLALPELAKTVVTNKPAENFGFGLISEKNVESTTTTLLLSSEKTGGKAKEINLATIVEDQDGIETTYGKQLLSDNNQSDNIAASRKDGPVSVDSPTDADSQTNSVSPSTMASSSSAVQEKDKYFDAASILSDLEYNIGEKPKLSNDVVDVAPTKENTGNDIGTDVKKRHFTLLDDAKVDASTKEEIAVVNNGQITVSAGQEICSWRLDDDYSERPGTVKELAGSDTLHSHTKRDLIHNTEESAPNSVNLPNAAPPDGIDTPVGGIFVEDGKPEPVALNEMEVPSSGKDNHHNQEQKSEAPRHFTFSGLGGDDINDRNFSRMNGPNAMPVNEEAVMTPPSNIGKSFASDMYLSPPTPEYEEGVEIFLSATESHAEKDFPPFPTDATQPEKMNTDEEHHPEGAKSFNTAMELVKFKSDSIVPASDIEHRGQLAETIVEGTEEQPGKKVNSFHTQTELVKFTSSELTQRGYKSVDTAGHGNSRPTKAQADSRQERPQNAESLQIVHYNSDSTELVENTSKSIVSVRDTMQPEKAIDKVEASKNRELIEVKRNSNDSNGHDASPSKALVKRSVEHPQEVESLQMSLKVVPCENNPNELVENISNSIVLVPETIQPRKAIENEEIVEETESKSNVAQNVEKGALSLEQAKLPQSRKKNPRDKNENSDSEMKRSSDVDPQNTEEESKAVAGAENWSIDFARANAGNEFVDKRESKCVINRGKAASESSNDKITAQSKENRTEGKVVSAINDSKTAETALPPKGISSATSSSGPPSSHKAPVASVHRLSRRSKERRRARSRSRSVTRRGTVDSTSGNDKDYGSTGETPLAEKSKNNPPVSICRSEAGSGSVSSAGSLSFESTSVSSAENASEGEKEKEQESKPELLPPPPKSSNNSENSTNVPPSSHKAPAVTSVTSLARRSKERRRARSRSRSVTRSGTVDSSSSSDKDYGSTGHETPLAEKKVATSTDGSKKNPPVSMCMSEAGSGSVSSAGSISPESKSVSSAENASEGKKGQESKPGSLPPPKTSSNSENSASGPRSSHKAPATSVTSLTRRTNMRRGRSRSVTRSGTTVSESKGSNSTSVVNVTSEKVKVAQEDGRFPLSPRSQNTPNSVRPEPKTVNNKDEMNRASNVASSINIESSKMEATPTSSMKKGSGTPPTTRVRARRTLNERKNAMSVRETSQGENDPSLSSLTSKNEPENPTQVLHNQTKEVVQAPKARTTSLQADMRKRRLDRARRLRAIQK